MSEDQRLLQYSWEEAAVTQSRRCYISNNEDQVLSFSTLDRKHCHQRLQGCSSEAERKIKLTLHIVFSTVKLNVLMVSDTGRAHILFLQCCKSSLLVFTFESCRLIAQYISDSYYDKQEKKKRTKKQPVVRFSRKVNNHVEQ